MKLSKNYSEQSLDCMDPRISEKKPTPQYEVAEVCLWFVFFFSKKSEFVTILPLQIKTSAVRVQRR